LDSVDKVYRGLVLDPFQREAIAVILKGHSLLVAAPTGVGKTLVADYLIETMYRRNRRVIYTAPIKALSNQKYKQFKQLMGEESVGILTGDIVINPDAPILVMTTEIFRNLLHLSPERVADVAYVIFDEIHYIDDPERGSVWEESLIFMPKTMRFLGLSATIPNVEDLAQWISGVQQQPVAVIRHEERTVPLQHFLFEPERGIVTEKQLRKLVKKYKGPMRIERMSHLKLLDYLDEEYLPCLFFTFSRKQCQDNARALYRVRDYLNSQEKQQVAELIRAHMEKYGKTESARLPELQEFLLSGIAYHHAGMLPMMKELVEDLFEKRLIKVLYCTETFAVGLNFPCKTVCFNSLSKWDGVEFRSLKNREYFQMAGRAGRRGIDTHGYVFSIVELADVAEGRLPSRKEDEIEPLMSQFSLSYNTVLNLVAHYDRPEIESILHKNFASWQRQKNHDDLTSAKQELLAELAQLDPQCEHLDSNDCPLKREVLAKELKKLRRKVDEAVKSVNYRSQRKKLLPELRALERKLAMEAARCSKGQIQQCRQEQRRRKQIQNELRRITRQLSRLAPKNAYLAEFESKHNLLSSLDYIRDGVLTARGEFAAKIHGQELLVTEIYFEGIFHELDVHQLNALAVAIGYEPRRGELVMRQRLVDLSRVFKIYKRLERIEQNLVGASSVLFNEHMVALAYHWSRGEDFAQLVAYSNLDEGDIVYNLRRGIDLLRQVRGAVGNDDPVLAAKIRLAIERMDRDEVSIVL